jgi:hypothetical protein
LPLSAATYLLQPGTPFVYYGEEIGQAGAQIPPPTDGTPPDGALTIAPAECLGACDFAPCILANDDLLKNMTPETAEAELKKPRARAT